MKNGVWHLAMAMLAMGKLKRELNKMDISKQLGPVTLDLALSQGKLVGSVEVPLITLLDEAVAKAEAALGSSVAKEIIDVVYGAIKAELMK